MKPITKTRLNKTVITFVDMWRAKRIPPISLLYGYQKCRCFYCDEFIEYASHCKKIPNGYTIDHVFPNSWGFTKAGNIVLACRDCNERKESSIPTQAQIRKAVKLYNLMGFCFIARLRLR